jgi:hypothetical protein
VDSGAIETAASKPDCTRDFAFGNAEIEVTRLRSAAQSGARDAVSRVALWSVTPAIRVGATARWRDTPTWIGGVAD